MKSREEGAMRLLYVGQISRHKGVAQLLEAVISLFQARPALILDVVGGSAFTNDLERELRLRIEDEGLGERIVFHGSVQDPSPFYQRATVLIVPSLFEEPAANVVLEAKRFGLPAIVYPSGGLPELVIHQVTGFVCDEKSEEALIAGVHWMLEDEKRLCWMRARAIEESQNVFSATKYRKKWKEVYLQRTKGHVV